MRGADLNNTNRRTPASLPFPQHKLLAKSVVEMSRNASAQYAELAGDIASLAATLAKVRSGFAYGAPTGGRMGARTQCRRCSAVTTAPQSPALFVPAANLPCSSAASSCRRCPLNRTPPTRP